MPDISDVFAVRCPSAACRKFMLVEADDRGKVVPCLICKVGIQIPAGSVAPAPAVLLPPPPAPIVPPPTAGGYNFAPK